MKKIGKHWAVTGAVLATMLIGVASEVQAGTLALGDDWSLDYLVDLTYSLAVRTDDAADSLSDNVNGNDGDRNIERGSLINNRAAVLSELNLRRGRYGVFVRGSAFYDDVYARSTNDNDSPATVNKSGRVDKFSNAARDRLGRRIRLLDAYVYGAWTIGSTDLSLRVGDQVVSWGESLFFPNMSGAQAPADATKSNVPGTEVKEVLLPSGQVYAQWGLTQRLSVSAYYQYQYDRTELNPVGAYFSSTDLVGPGAEFFILDLPPGAPVSRVEIPRGSEIRSHSDSQWGVRTKYLFGLGTELALQHIRYHDKNPTGVVFNNPAPADVLAGKSSYQTVYASGVDMTAISLTTDFSGTALAGEVSYRDGAGLSVNAPGLFGAPVPTPTVGDVWQVNINATKILTPTRFWDQLVLIGEVSDVYVSNVKSIDIGGQSYSEISNTRNAAAFQGQIVANYLQVFPGWDLSVGIAHANAFDGKTAVASSLGSLTGKSDRRYGITFGFLYLDNLLLSAAYNRFSGHADTENRALADRSFASFSAKYSF